MISRRTPGQITPHQEREMQRLFDAGKSLPHIATQVGVNYETVRDRFKGKMPLNPPGRKRLTPEMEKQIELQYNAGATALQIAAAMDIPLSTITRRFTEFNFRKNQLAKRAVNEEKPKTKRQLEIEKEEAEIAYYIPEGPPIIGRCKRNEPRAAALKREEPPVAPSGLKHVSTRQLYEGDMTTFIVDVTNRKLTIEVIDKPAFDLSFDEFILLLADFEGLYHLIAPPATDTEGNHDTGKEKALSGGIP